MGIVHDSMNATCSIDRFYPTATPTRSPTSGIIGGIPTGTKAEDLIWFYMIFVVLFIFIVAGAYCYWRKKSARVGKFEMEDDEELDMQPTNTADATYTHS